MKKLTKQQLIERIAELSIEHRHAHYAVTCLREDYKDEVFRYFRAHGEPYPNRHGIDYSDPAYGGVIRATAQSYERMSKAKQHRYNVKRRLDTAVRNLMGERGDQLKLPTPTAVRRTTATGETLQ